MNDNKQVGDLCEVCNTPLIAGKKGGAYCKPCYIKWAEDKKDGGGAAPKPVQQQVDWEKISIGKVRHGLTTAFIQAGLKELDNATAQEINKITKFVMTGVHPDDPPFTE